MGAQGGGGGPPAGRRGRWGGRAEGGRRPPGREVDGRAAAKAADAAAAVPIEACASFDRPAPLVLARVGPLSALAHRRPDTAKGRPEAEADVEAAAEAAAAWRAGRPIEAALLLASAAAALVVDARPAAARARRRVDSMWACVCA